MKTASIPVALSGGAKTLTLGGFNEPISRASFHLVPDETSKQSRSFLRDKTWPGKNTPIYLDRFGSLIAKRKVGGTRSYTNGITRGEEEREKNRGGGFSSGGGETAEFHGRARRKEDEEGGILTGEETLIAVSEEGVRLERKVTRPKREKEEEIREGDPVNCRRSVCYPSAVHAPCKLCSIGYSSSPPSVISFPSSSPLLLALLHARLRTITPLLESV